MILTLLLSIGIPIAYFLTGAVYVRSQSVRLYSQQYRKNEAQWHYPEHVESWTRSEYNGMRLWRFFFWPVGVLYDKVWPHIQSWFDAPITNYNAETDSLRESLVFWEEQAADRSLDETNREIARSFAKGYRDMINERIRIR